MPEEVAAKKNPLAIRLLWGSMTEIPTVYANQLFIAHTGGEFYLIFGELTPPPDLDRDNPPDYLEIRPVAKIALSTENMLRVAEVIGENVSQYRGELRGEEDEEGIER
jgi:hypothetical protein